jgi:hypothetical protein
MTLPEDFPRVLIINAEPFWNGSATGLTMGRLFRGWPRDRLGCLFDTGIQPDPSFCAHYWKITPRELWHLGGLFRIFGSHERVEGMSRVSGPENPEMSAAQAWLKANARRLRQHLGGQAVRELDAFQIPDQICREIEDFAPQVIYSALGSNLVMKMVLDLAERLDLPVVPHFMDDWPSTLYQASIFRSILRRTMYGQITAILTRSPKRLVIGDAMAEEYVARYAGEFVPFMNAVEPELFGAGALPPPARSSTRLVYVGGLHLKRWLSLREIGLSLRALREEGYQAEVSVYSPPRFAHEGKKLDYPPFVYYKGSLLPAQIPALLRDADILLHVESFDRHSRTYARYSVSTKIPEYMAAARPILAYGPEELASIRYIRDTGAGLVVGRQDHCELLGTIRSLLESADRRDALGRRGFQTAISRHNAALQREQFRTVLGKAAA